MEFRLLGPVEVSGEGRVVQLGGTKPRALLAALLLDHGRVVPADRLVEAIWGEAPPPTARAVLQTYVATLRRSFERAGMLGVIVSDRLGYRAEIPDGALDLTAFERQVTRGRREVRDGRHREAAEVFRAALAVWRGPALDGIGDSFLRAEASRLDEQRLTVLEERIAAELAIGRSEELVGELYELVELYPQRERLRRDLMLALYRAGRQADALRVYREGRAVLVAELGIEPGPELRDTHGAILRSDPALLLPTPVVPHQLPAALADFTGRAGEIATLRNGLTRPGGVPMWVVAGPGGAGKSVLALQVAHELAESFPDGQLHVELHGTSATPATPGEILSRLLRQLGRPSGPLPSTVEERAAVYRSLVAGRRMLVVLDDAAAEEQVRPLLPGASGCAVVVTSRHRLVSLAGASLVDLGVLPQQEALELFGRVAGTDRIGTRVDVARRIVRDCGHLPLAIRIAGSRLAARRHWTIDILASRLADEKRRLDELAVGDQEVRASIGLSYETLTPKARKLLRRLGLLGLPSLPAWVAATAAETSHDEAETLLEHLEDCSLVDVDSADPAGQARYRLHDLVRLFAAERAQAEETPQANASTVRRVLGGWLWLIKRINQAAPSAAIPRRGQHRLGTPVDADVERIAVAQPHAWFKAEEEALVAGVELAAGMDLDEIAVELASALCHSIFVTDNMFEAWHRTHGAALAVARRAGNILGEATLLAELGQLRLEQDRYAEAREHLSQALSTFRSAGDPRGEAAALVSLGSACREQSYLPEALHFLARARELWTELGDTAALAHVRRLAGAVHLETGDYPTAWAELSAALSTYTAARNRRAEALTLRTMSLYHRARGDYQPADDLAGRALTILREIGDQLLAAYALRAQAKARIRLGRHAEAHSQLTEALATSQDLGDRWGQACTVRVLGELHLAKGHLYRAKDFLDDALRRWDEIGVPLFRARTLHDLAVLHDQLGDTTTAHAHRTQAIELFRLHGAREHAELSTTESPQV